MLPENIETVVEYSITFKATSSRSGDLDTTFGRIITEMVHKYNSAE